MKGIEFPYDRWFRHGACKTMDQTMRDSAAIRPTGLIRMPCAVYGRLSLTTPRAVLVARMGNLRADPLVP